MMDAVAGHAEQRLKQASAQTRRLQYRCELPDQLRWRQQQFVGMMLESRKRLLKLLDAVGVARATVDSYNQRVQGCEERQYAVALNICAFCTTLDNANQRGATALKALQRDKKTLINAVHKLRRRHEQLMREALRGEDVGPGEARRVRGFAVSSRMPSHLAILALCSHMLLSLIPSSHGRLRSALSSRPACPSQDLWTHLERSAVRLDKDCCETAVLLQRAKRQLATERTAVELLREQVAVQVEALGTADLQARSQNQARRSAHPAADDPLCSLPPIPLKRSTPRSRTAAPTIDARTHATFSLPTC